MTKCRYIICYVAVATVAGICGVTVLGAGGCSGCCLVVVTGCRDLLDLEDLIAISANNVLITDRFASSVNGYGGFLMSDYRSVISYVSVAACTGVSGVTLLGAGRIGYYCFVLVSLCREVEPRIIDEILICLSINAGYEYLAAIAAGNRYVSVLGAGCRGYYYRAESVTLSVYVGVYVGVATVADVASNL